MLLFLLYFSVKNVTSTSDTRVSWGFTCDRSTGPSLTPRLSIAGLLATSLQAWRTPAERAADLHLPPPPKKTPTFFFHQPACCQKFYFFSKHNQEFVLPFMYLYVMHILYVSSLWMFNDRMYFFFLCEFKISFLTNHSTQCLNWRTALLFVHIENHCYTCASAVDMTSPVNVVFCSLTLLFVCLPRLACK